MPRPDLDAYREAQARARQLMGEMRRETAERIESDLRRYSEGLRRRLTADLGDLSERALQQQRALAQASQINSEAATQLAGRLTQATGEGRNLTFEESLQVWKDSGRAAAQSAGVDMAALGAVRPPPVTMLGAFDAVGAAQNWQTLLRGHIDNAASEANRIIRAGMTEGVGPDELARRLRRYVVGSEELDELFEDAETVTGQVKKIDMRQRIPEELQDAARQMQYNARRVAMSEIQNARHEAEIQHMIRDPLIRAVKWELSPTHDIQCACDGLARADWYGLGRGVYPVGKAPVPPHPFCSCQNRSLTRPSERMGEEKPSPGRQLSGDDVSVNEWDGLTENAADRAREQAERAVQTGEQIIGEARRRAA